MRTPSIRHATYIKLFATLGALIASSALVWQASHSAYSAKTYNNGDSWATGQVTLINDASGSAASGSAMFTATGLKPGATGVKCILISSNSSLASVAKLYGANYSTTNALGTYITLTVDQGSGATTSSCSGFTADSGGTGIYSGTLDAFGTGKTSYSTGVGTWSITGTPTETKAYRFTYTLSSAAPDTTQGGTANIGFTWEAQNS